MKKLRNIKGAALVEYGILVGLIAVLAISAVLALGEEVNETFVAVETSLASSLASAGI
jgi:pilus assembly protein Flp/PilA